MKRFIGIKNGKVFDICSKLVNKRKFDNGIPINLTSVEYIETEMGNVVIDDTWDYINNINLKDSPRRFIEPQKSKLDLLKEEVELLKLRINSLELG